MVRVGFYTYLFRETFFSLTVRGGIEVNLTSIVRGMVFSTGVTFFSGVVEGDVFPFSEEVPDEDGAADEVKTVSELRGGTFSADSIVSSDDELPPPKNPLSLPTKGKLRLMKLGRKEPRPLTSDSIILDITECNSIRHRNKS